MRSHTEEEKLEGAMKIFEALSGVDEELLLKSESVSHVKQTVVIPFWKYAKALAACVCVLLLGGLLWKMPQQMEKNQVSKDCAIEDMFLMKEDAGCAEEAEYAEEVCDTDQSFIECDNGSMNLTDVNKQTGEADGNDSVKLTDENLQEKELSGNSGMSMTDKNQQTLKLSEQEVRNIEVFRPYIPETLPAGYAFESAGAVAAQDTDEFEEIRIIWTKGMDDIWWEIKAVDASGISCVDVKAVERYDTHLYDIPYCDTVPEEYREDFLYPVFCRGDFSLEVIEKRMKSVQDAGDTGTPGGRFSVLYKEGILISFDGKASAKDVWAMFESLPR